MTNIPQKTTDSTDLDNPGLCPTCPICQHAINDRLTEIYFEKEKNVKETAKWFNNKFADSFKLDIFKKHFKEHIETFVTEDSFLRKRRMKKLEQQTLASKKEKGFVFNLMNQMTWELMKDVYVNRPQTIKTSKDRTEQQKVTKQFIELAKTFREAWQMELNVLGMGKTEEEMRKTMENYAAGMLKQASKSLSEFPEAQKKLNDFLDINVDPGKKEKVTETIRNDDDGT